MAHIVIVGAGLGGIPMALEMKTQVEKTDRVTLIGDDPIYHFVPSNPWVGVGWRQPADIEVEIEPVCKKRGIEFNATGVRKIIPEKNMLELGDGSKVSYDYLILSVGPAMNFGDIPGFCPGDGGFTHSICRTDHAAETAIAWEKFMENPGPIVAGASQGVSCFGPAYEFTMVMETDLRRRKIRDRVPMTFITPEPYIGHLGLGGVGDTKGLLESVMRERSIRWICNASIERIEKNMVHAVEFDEDGNEKRHHELPFTFSMIMPPFKGIAATTGVDGLANPKGFVIVDKHQQNPVYSNIFALGVCVAMPQVETTPVPTGVPKTGFMIESMSVAIASNIKSLMSGGEATFEPTLNAVCLADFGDSGVGFVAMPQIPPRNLNWSSKGKHIHLAKLAYEKYFLHKIRGGLTEPFYEKAFFAMLGIDKLKVVK